MEIRTPYAVNVLGAAPLRAAAAAFLLTLLGSMAGAQDAAEPPAEPSDAAEPSEAAAPPAPESPARRPAADDDVFVPSEEVAVDQEIVFPVDI